jgi:hypothetical protein
MGDIFIMDEQVSAPLLVQDLDLVNKAWPPSQAPTPMVISCWQNACTFMKVFGYIVELLIWLKTV